MSPYPKSQHIYHAICNLLYMQSQQISNLLLAFIILLQLILPVISKNIVQIDYFRVAPHQPLKSQIGNANQMEIKNYQNFQYYVRIDIGMPLQKFEVILDTGSPFLWVPAKNSTNSPISSRKYQSNESLTRSNQTGGRQSIEYGKGSVAGLLIQDVITFENVRGFLKFIIADYQHDTESLTADGIMGLSNSKLHNNIFDVGHQNGSLISSKFGFKLGLPQLREKSYFSYNISEEQLLNATFIKATRTNYWTLPIRRLTMGNMTLNSSEALIDTGTSLIIFPQKQYAQMDTSFFQQHCTPYSSTSFRSCDSSITYPNISILTPLYSLNITPEMYMIQGSRGRQYLGIDRIATIPFVILGDVFLHHHEVIFDKQNNKIGLISNHRFLKYFVSSDWKVILLDIISAGVLLACAVLVFMNRKGRNSMLVETLREGQNIEIPRI